MFAQVMMDPVSVEKLNDHATLILYEQAANVGILARLYYFHLVPLLLQASFLLVYFCHPYTF